MLLLVLAAVFSVGGGDGGCWSSAGRERYIN